MGNNFGRAGDRETQAKILRAALAMIDTANAGDLVDYPGEWGGNYQYAPGGNVIAATT